MMERIHLIGIGGTGLSAIAHVLAQKGYAVSGSDRALSPLARELQAAGIKVMIGHRAENIQGADLVVRSSAIPDDNEEVQAAINAGIPVLKRADFLPRLLDDQRCLAVAGTHGKTTTTAMLAWMLSSLQQDPSFIVGGQVQNLGVNAKAGQGPDFVIEADEYDHMFLGLTPTVAVVTNIEHDHPDCYPTPEDYFNAFKAFTDRILPGGSLIGCVDDQGVRTLITGLERGDISRMTYGLHPDADYRAVEIHKNTHNCPEFSIIKSGQETSPIAHLSLQVPGEHNIRNALAAIAVADRIGLLLEPAAKAVGEYIGSGRRFEIRGVVNGITVIDDYAHHPTEIRATLSAARSRFPGQRIWAVWQPHTFSRTQSLFDLFAASFQDADEVLVTPIYAAREPQCDFSAAQIVQAMRHPSAHYTEALTDAAANLLINLQPGDVMIVLSAGDADQISATVLTALKERFGQNG